MNKQVPLTNHVRLGITNPNSEEQSYFAKSAFLPQGWVDNVIIQTDAQGYIKSINQGERAPAFKSLEGFVLPGMPNLHSHSFQRALAGFAEQLRNEKDSFWTWRQRMYEFLDKLQPEDLFSIAAQAYIEMLKAGFTTVGEFHYLHHQPNGIAYDQRSLTSDAIIRAAKDVGIAITHLPVLYSFAGFGSVPPALEQKRFINTAEQLLGIISSLITQYQQDPQVTLGMAFHSLRALSPQMLQETLKSLQNFKAKLPIHIHIAEQQKEVDDCLQWSGQRPVEWLLNQVSVDEHWCLVHATHLTNRELQDLALSKAVVGLCPVTEANLGDGLFNLKAYQQAKGIWGIGTDSNISACLREELRLLEYGQRLMHQQRAIVKISDQPSVGLALYQKALAGGAQALGRPNGSLEVGKRADFIVLDPDSPSLIGKNKDYIFDALIFSGNTNPIRDVIVGGQHLVKNSKHRDEEKILKAFSKTMKSLADRVPL